MNLSVNDKTTTKFIYVGSHSAGRNLDIVLKAIVKASNFKANASFKFVGCKKSELDAFLLIPGIADLINKDVISFISPVARSDIPQYLAEGDIGLSLIPPRKVYYESSPTKLAEYLGAGLAVLSNVGIPMQEKFVNESKASLLVDWSVDAIAEGIVMMCSNREAIDTWSRNGQVYAERHLQYSNYLSTFREILSLDD